MTCIVGIEFGDSVFIGGDIQGTGWNYKLAHTQPKVFNRAGVLFGFAGSYRFGQLLEHAVLEPVPPGDEAAVYRWLITVLVPSIKKTLKDSDYEGGGSCLIGIKNQLWELQSDFSVLRTKHAFAAVGSGYEYATGAMFTLNSTPLKTRAQAIQSVKAAILTAGSFCPTVGTESTVLSTDGFSTEGV